MPLMVLDEDLAEQVIKRRRASPAYRWDEVWEGVYVAMPLPDILYFDLAAVFLLAFYSEYSGRRGYRVHGHINISDRNRE
ncbi:MAG: hypothetical protein EXS09_03870 [Gemmataceae bacterium]|nr:hypothetical protein [Gemmataceae bacterium]